MLRHEGYQARGEGAGRLFFMLADKFTLVNSAAYCGVRHMAG